jgi:hypothetical protein
MATHTYADPTVPIKEAEACADRRLAGLFPGAGCTRLVLGDTVSVRVVPYGASVWSGVSIRREQRAEDGVVLVGPAEVD